MNNLNLKEICSEFNNIKKNDIVNILESTLQGVLKKQYGDMNFDIIINIDKGDIEIWKTRTIVDDTEVSCANEISLSDAILLQSDFEIGEDVSEEVKLSDINRRNLSILKQTLYNKIKDYGKEQVRQNYSKRIGELFFGEVYQVHSKTIFCLDEEGNEAILPFSEKMYKDNFRKGDSVIACIKSVENSVVLSRNSAEFIQALFEKEIDHIFEGLITIKTIVRETDEKTKVVIESYDDRIDPVAICVGSGGSRIKSIQRYIHNEPIDIISYTTNKNLYVQRALNCKVSKIEFNDDTLNVFLKSDDIPIAIGKHGSNLRLASELLDSKIDLYRYEG